MTIKGTLLHVNDRFTQLNAWVCEKFNLKSVELLPLTGDAGFRCYYRFLAGAKSFIAVDAPIDKSNNKAFVEIQKVLAAYHINVPEILHKDLDLGFLCISDFGNTLLADKLSGENMMSFYQKAIDLLPKISVATFDSDYSLPVYNKEFIKTELNIFSEWLLAEHLKIELTADQSNELERCFNVLVDNALEQPQVIMHRDYHSRNIMLLANDELGIIDFQDAVKGPVMYDVVSLLRDCYIRWPQQQVTNLFSYFCKQMSNVVPELKTQEAQYQRWFDLMGIQRHVKASGIFARLNLRDGKSGYLKDIPLTLEYIIDISEQYTELEFLTLLVRDQVLPAFQKTNNKMNK